MIQRDFRYLREKLNDAGAAIEFEKICYRLFNQMEKHPVHMVRNSQGDKGIDIYDGELEKEANIYQCKFFLDHITNGRKESIRKSFRTIISNDCVKMKSWTLCVPCVLSFDESKWWEKWKGKQEERYQIKIHLYDGEFLLVKLKEFHLYKDVFDLKDGGFEKVINDIYDVPTSINLLQYNCKMVHGIVGREREIGVLRDFLGDNKHISFWVVSGPAGTGKSKLAYHMAQSEQLSNEWKFKFITSLNSKVIKKIAKLNDWNYNHNLCLIIDYANELVYDLKNWLTELFQTKRYSTQYKLRIILIAREGTKYTHYYENHYPEWFIKMTDHSELLLENMYSSDFLELRGLDSKFYNNIINMYCKAYGRNDLTEIEKNKITEYIENDLQDEAKYARPLYIIFAIKAYLQTNQLHRWDRRELVNCDYDRNIEVWQKEIANDEEREALLQLLMYATIVGEWDPDNEVPEHIREYAEQLQKIIDNREKDPRQRWFSILTGRCFARNDRFILPALTPDLVGEFYVLARIAKMGKHTLDKWISYFVKNIEICKAFFIRLVQNYGDDKVYGYTILKIFRKMIDYAEKNNNQSDIIAFHEAITDILDRYLAGYKGSEDPNIYKELSQLIHFYANRYHEQYQCWAEIEICRLYSNRKDESFKWKKIHFQNVKIMYENWPNSKVIKKEYISYLGDMIDFSMGAHTIANGSLDSNTKWYIELLDTYIKRNPNFLDNDIRIVMLLACIKVIAAASIVNSTYNIAEQYTMYIHDLIADSSKKQMLIICYLENVDSIVRQLSKTGNHIALKSVLNNLQIYYNEFENVEDYYKCVWIGISVLSQLIEILCSYECLEEALFITSLFWEIVDKFNIYKDNDWALNQHKESSINRILTSVFISDEIKRMFLL